jgi:hypothetical protein
VEKIKSLLWLLAPNYLGPEELWKFVTEDENAKIGMQIRGKCVRNCIQRNLSFCLGKNLCMLEGHASGFV